MKLGTRKGRSSVFSFYGWCFSLAAAGLVGLIIFFNLWMDFAGVFGFSDRVPYLDLRADNRRLVIPGLIRQFQPDCLIVGTSRVGRGIDPQHSSLQSYKCLNLYLNAGDAHEVAKVVEFAAETVNVRLVLIGLDFFMFDQDLDVPSYSKRFIEANYENGSLPWRFLSNLNLLISLDGIRNNLLQMGKVPLTWKEVQEHSFRDAEEKVPKVSVKAWYEMASQLWSLVNPRSRGHGYHDFRLDPTKVESMMQVIQTLGEKKIRFKIFLNPVYVTFMEAIHHLHLDDQYWSIVEKTLEKVSRYNNDLYDFGGYNSVTTEFFDGETSGCFPEAGHYTPDVGGAMVEIMLNQKLQKDQLFGKRLTLPILDHHKGEVQKRREFWKRSQPRDFKIIQRTLECSLEGNPNSCVTKIVDEEFAAWRSGSDFSNPLASNSQKPCVEFS